MSVPTAELSARAATARRRPAAAALTRGLAGGRLYLALGGLALVIAGLSLLIPSTPSYDPWSWLVWGREIVHLDLHTTGGPTWKPLPVIFTTVLAPFGKAAPDLWLIVARAGALMAVAMTFKLATRLTGRMAGLWRTHAGEAGEDVSASAGSTGEDTRAPAGALVPVLLAGVIAAGSLVVSRGFINGNALGYSEGLMTALVLIAIDRHLDGHRRQAFAVGFVAALDRPELWLLWGPFGLYLWWRDPGARRLVIGLFALIPVLWFGPELWGSGHLFRGVSRAQQPRSNSPAFAKCPFCTELAGHAWPTVLLRVKVVAGVAMAVAALGLWRTRRSRRGGGPLGGSRRAGAALLAMGVAGFGWWVLISVLTQAGFSGNDRYLVLGAALVAVAGGVGWGWAAGALGAVLGRLLVPLSAGRLRSPVRIAVPLLGGVGALAAAAVFMALPPWIGANVTDVQATHRALVYQGHLRREMARAVRDLGGSSGVLGCGTVMTEGFQVPMLAWTLGVHTVRVDASPLKGGPLPPPPDVIFQVRAQHHASLLPRVSDWPTVSYHRVPLAGVHAFRVYSRCAGRLGG
ncbi:MAG: hypothetical protein ACR2IP_04210 [Solirubrobacteraceae bacterium]